MNIRRHWFTVLGEFVIALAIASPMFAADATLSIDCSAPGHAISPRLIGVFFEDINFGADGGLCAELVKNGSFEIGQPPLGWTTTGKTVLSTATPRYAANPTYLRLEAESSAVNSGFRGMGFREGEGFMWQADVRTTAKAAARLKVELLDEAERGIASQEFPVTGSAWRRLTHPFQPTATTLTGALRLSVVGAGRVDLDHVSLCPEQTWRNHPQGLRDDLVKKLLELKPAFVRFPGGCIVEGFDLSNRYDWKQTIGPVAERRPLINRWNMEFKHRLAPDYYQSFNLGFFEYFQLAEEIGAEPLPILGCGMACQFNSGELVPLAELQPYIQDALDLIEFANGPVTSEWGAKRAAMGHPKPFGMKLLGVGNEQWGPEYFARAERFVAAIQTEHPEIEIVSSAGPFPSGPHFDFAWPLLRKQRAKIVDEHCYAMPDWFLREATRFDSYDRQGPKIFMGEYAAQSVAICSPNNRNSLRCALAEAAFLTGLERNSDVVTMSAYAPLFGHEEAWQWRPNLIWFDNLSSYATPNYYVQQLFSLHRGDVVLPHELVDAAPAAQAQVGFGVGANRATAEFADVIISSYAKAYDWQAADRSSPPLTLDGDWQNAADTLNQRDANAVARRYLGGLLPERGELSLRARVVRGRGGLVIVIRRTDGGSRLEWILGDANNTRHKLVAHLASHSETPTVLADVAGSVKEGEWISARVEVEGDTVKCFVNDQLVHEVKSPAPPLPRLFTATSFDQATGETIVKLVNPTGTAREVDIDLLGAKQQPTRMTVHELTGEPDGVNSIEAPQAIAPQTTEAALTASKFTTTVAPYSLRVLRISGK